MLTGGVAGKNNATSKNVYKMKKKECGLKQITPRGGIVTIRVVNELSRTLKKNTKLRQI